MARIELDGVGKSWGEVTAVEGVSLSIDDGEFLAVLGPSGCGKSTTLFMLAGIYAPTTGEISFDGEVVNEVEAKDRNIGIVFQSYALYPHMSVRQNIGFPLRFKRIDDAEIERRVVEMAELVRVGDLLDRRPTQLSGGQQQRVALARALVKGPQLLLLDEPLSNLDATLRLSMRTEIKALQRRTGVTAILVTHDQLEATTMADRVVCMSKGRVEQMGTPDDLYLRPDSMFVASFIGAPPINLIAGKARDGAFHVNDCSLPLTGAAQGEVHLGIRPEGIRIDDGALAGRIHDVEPMGREVLYVIDTELGPLRALEAGANARHDVGADVSLSFDAGDTLVFDTRTERRIAHAHVGVA
jgi:inositol-phosphate transport system ATP-binding protein